MAHLTNRSWYSHVWVLKACFPIRAGAVVELIPARNIVERFQGLTKLVEIQTGKVEEKLARVSLLQTLVAKTSEAEKG